MHSMCILCGGGTLMAFSNHGHQGRGTLEHVFLCPPVPDKYYYFEGTLVVPLVSRRWLVTSPGNPIDT